MEKTSAELQKALQRHNDIPNKVKVNTASLEIMVTSVVSGIMANPNTRPTTKEHFDNIADKAIRISKTVLIKLNNEKELIKLYHETE
jgi:hypothetical protein